MTYHGTFSALLLVILAAAIPGRAQIADQTIRPCDSPGAETWIVKGPCGSVENRIIAWPLFWFDEHDNPKPLSIGECTTSAVACGLDAVPRAWWIGPLLKDTSAVVPTTTTLSLSRQIGLVDNRIFLEAVQNVLNDLERETRLIELAWRLGGNTATDAARPPIFRLRRKARADESFVQVGDCGKQIGRAHV